MRKKLTVSIADELITDLEETRTSKKSYPKVIQDKSHFVEKILTIGLKKYQEKEEFFCKVGVSDIDLNQIKW